MRALVVLAVVSLAACTREASPTPVAWSDLTGRPASFPVDPAQVQLRVSAACSEGGYMTAVQQDGSVTCASRFETVQLPPATWATFQCASLTTSLGALGGMALPGLRFQPSTGCSGVRRANAVLGFERTDANPGERSSRAPTPSSSEGRGRPAHQGKTRATTRPAVSNPGPVWVGT